MSFFRRRERRPARGLNHGFRNSRFSILIILVVLALSPALFFHLKDRRIRKMQLKRCGWLKNPPLVCAHGGDSTNAFPNTVASYQFAIQSKVDCVEIDVSRSSDGFLFALHDRDLQRISGNTTSRVGHLTMKEIEELDLSHQPQSDSHQFSPIEDVPKIEELDMSRQPQSDSQQISTIEDAPEIEELDLSHQLQSDRQKISTIEDALKLISGFVRVVILDVKIGPPSYEKGLAQDILSAVRKMQCENCVIWTKSDSLARDIIKLSSDITVGYIVMIDPSSGARSRLLRMEGAGVVGVYHPLIDENLTGVLHRRNKKVYAWTVDDADSMARMLQEHVDAVVTSNPIMLQRVMHNLRTACLEEGYSPAWS